MLYRNTVAAYGIINVLGGVIGLLASKSVWSLVVGGAAGFVLLWLASQVKTRPGFAYRTAGVVAVLLAGFWVFRITEVLRDGKSPMMPLMNLGLAVGVLAILGYGHMAAQKKSQSAD